MKNITPAMQSHLQQDTTTLTTMWKITRADKQVFAFTELDEDVTFEGIVYKSVGGFNKSAMKASGTFGVDNLEVSGFLQDDTIPDEEMRNGAFDYAEVEIFLINYMDHSMGTIKMRYGFFGEVKSAPSGAFLVELRGLVQLLGQKIGEVYTPECRADLGDARCKFKLVTAERQNGKAYIVGDRVLVNVLPSGHRPNVLIPLVNADFETTGGWVFHGTVYSVGTTFVQPPPGSTRFAYIAKNVADFSQLYQTHTLLTGGVTAEDIETGDLKLRPSAMINSVELGASVECNITFYTGSSGGGLSAGTVNLRYGRIVPAREWIEWVPECDIPPTARSFRIQYRMYDIPTFTVAALGVDSVRAEIIFPNAPQVDYRIFGGVEFECVVAGTTAVSAPVFDPTLGIETVDGTVTWEAVLPEHNFLVTVAEDATLTNTIVIAEDIPKVDGWFNWGVCRVLSGENIGRSIECQTWTQATKTIVFAMPLARRCLAGDQLVISTGCDKSRNTCRTKFNNLLNFRGEPDIPGIGQYFKVAGL